MKKILIADDDALVRSYLDTLIDWNQHGFAVVGMAQDGEQLIEMFHEYHPDIILLDIDMPVLNGIDALRQLKGALGFTKVMILSCHDDFIYVKEAMRLGAEEYILKDTITPEKLLELLDVLVREAEGTDSDESPTLEKEANVLMQLLRGEVETVDWIKPTAMLAVRVDDYEERFAYRPASEKEPFYQALIKNCREACAGQSGVRCVHVRGGLFAVFFAWEGVPGLQKKQEMLRENADTIVRYLGKYMDISVRVAISKVDVFGGDVPAYWEDAQNALSYAFYEDKRIFYGWQCEGVGKALPAEAEEFLDQAETYALQQKTDQMEESLQRILAIFEAEKTNGRLVVDWCRKIERILKIETRIAPKNFKGVKALVKEYVDACDKNVLEMNKYSATIASAIKYIHKNYKNGIQLPEVAEAAGLTTTYFSYAFHRETGMTFSDYLQSVRLRCAKDLLAKGNARIGEVAEQSGYNDVRHFNKIFKRRTGMTPKEYRRHNKKM